MKQTMKHQSLLSGIKSLGIMLSLGLALASCTKDDVAQNPAKPNEEENKNLTTFVAGGENKTRTSMDYNSGDFYWEANDYIYVKDDDGVLRKSTNAPDQKVASFKYKVPGKFTDHSSYEVYYFGKNSSNNQVVIPSAQTQSTPNNTEHFGVSGDYGTATATGVVGGSIFSFQLEHQEAYLVFHPYVSNTLLQNCYLTKIEVSSDNDIASTYTLNASTGTLLSVSTGAEADKEIILSTKGSGAYANGFPLKTASDNVAVNGAYMVIKPGTHTLKVRYWLKDVSTGIEGTVTKAFKAFNYDVNNYYDIDGNLNIRDYDGDHYYMWDAQEQYWKGHEWNHGGSQPTLNDGLPNATTSSDYAQNNTDSRFYNTSFAGYSISNPATHTSCKELPNVNEMTWYAAYGEPRWDADELWTTMGHLYKGGMWFKKKSVLQDEGHYSRNTAVDGTDWRTTVNFGTWSASQTLPSAADANKYFYLPALGSYGFGKLYDVGSYGRYWSSSAYPTGGSSSFFLYFNSGDVNLFGNYRGYGYRVDGFE